ncbi:MAG: 2-hydroxyacyl-CoA dehydratase [Firmicutes bacterium]|nr:2-hydroxyacyl-CoA dehydratase [Bacillota bacterium]
MAGPPLDDFGFHLSRSVLRHALGAKTIYALGRGILAMRRRAFSLRATSKVAEFALKETARAFDAKNHVIWSSAFAPVEILRSLGLTIFSPEAASAVFSAFGLAEKMLETAEESFHSRDTCTFHRVAMGALLEGLYPQPDGLVASSHLCDGCPGLFRNVYLESLFGKGSNTNTQPLPDQNRKPPYYIIDVPWGRLDDEAVRYTARQLEDMFYGLASCFGLSPDLDELKQAIRLSNEARTWAIRANELKRLRPCPVTAREVADYVYVMFTGFGSRDAAEIYRTLYDEARERVKDGGSGPNPLSERYRILWLHLRPFYAGHLWGYLEDKLGVKIVFDEFSHIYWDELDPDYPFESLARKALSHPGHGPIERRVKTVLRLVEDYQVDGVIHFSHWGCRQSAGGAVMIKDYLKKHGIPVLILDGDCIDRRNYAEGQTITRLEGFIEMLG